MEDLVTTGMNVARLNFSHGDFQVADSLKIKVIITSTQTRSMARFISRHRYKHLILAVTPSLKTYRRLALVWG